MQNYWKLCHEQRSSIRIHLPSQLVLLTRVHIDRHVGDLQSLMSEVSPSRSSGYWSTNQSEDKKEEEESTHEQLQRFVWTQVDSLVNEFGVYGQILSPNEDYIACNVVYEEGIPHRLWLSIQTSAMQSFQRWIQRRFGTTQLEPFHEPGVGEFLLARYSVDKCLYRAKVEEVDKVDGELVVMVRYVDYGNTGEGLSMQDLAPWSPFLGRIPPQVGKMLCYFFT